MAEDSWTVQIGVVDDPTTDGVPRVPTDVYSGDEAVREPSTPKGPPRRRKRTIAT